MNDRELKAFGMAMLVTLFAVWVLGYSPNCQPAWANDSTVSGKTK